MKEFEPEGIHFWRDLGMKGFKYDGNYFKMDNFEGIPSES